MILWHVKDSHACIFPIKSILLFLFWSALQIQVYCSIYLQREEKLFLLTHFLFTPFFKLFFQNVFQRLNKYLQKKCHIFFCFASIHPCEGGRKAGVMEIIREGEKKEESMKNDERKKPISCVKSDLSRWMSFVLFFSERLFLIPALHLSLSFIPFLYSRFPLHF